jgi:hypothetical protein
MLWKGYVGGALVDYACECVIQVWHWFRLMAEFDHELCFDWHWCSLGVAVAYSESVTVTLVRLRPGSAMISDGSLLIEAGFVRFVSLHGEHDEPESLILAQSERWRHA